MQNVNAGHRQRMRERMINEGLQNFKDHEVLEFLLFQYLPRIDTNKLAHRLLNKFGSFANILDSSPEQLMTVEGISKATACNLAILKEVWQRYRMSAAEKKSLSSFGDILRYSRSLVAECYVEKLFAVCLDHAGNFIASEEYTSGSLDRVDVDVKSVVTFAYRCSAAGLMLFHCHVRGKCEPSDDDNVFTEKMYFTLANMGIVLMEHIIFNSQGEYFSFYKTGELDKLADKYKEFYKK